MIVNRRHEIVYLHGDVGKFLNLPRGEPVLDLLSMLQAGYRSRVRAAIQEAFREARSARLTNVRLGRADKTFAVTVHLEPLRTRANAEPVVIVTFEEDLADLEHASTSAAGPPDKHAPPQGLIQQLEDELAAVKEDLRGTIDALEASNEELKASNEEIMSMNEEFRSTNEELETSKEELQSINEELTTLNAQLREKVELLHALSDDLNNVLTSTDIPIIILDPEFRIRRFTPGMTRLLNLIPTDVGRSLTDITRRFEDPTLLGDAKRVLGTLTPKESEVRTEDGTRYVRRIQPYRTNDDHIAGTVIAFVDVEAVKQAAEAVHAAQRYAEHIVETVREPLLILDESLSVVSANAAFYRNFKTDPERARGRKIHDVGNGELDASRLTPLLREVLSKRIPIDDLEVDYAPPDIGSRTLLVNAREIANPMHDGAQAPAASRRILLAIQDITQRKMAERRLAEIAEDLEERVQERTSQLEEANRVLRVANESLDAFTYVVGHDLKEPTRAVENLLSVIEADHGDSLPPEARDLLAKSRAANRRLSSLVTGLLAFSRASRVEATTPQAISLDEILRSEDCRTRYWQRLEERGATLEYPDPKMAVHAHPAAVSQILGNLVENAIKHNPTPRPWVRVRAHPLPGGKLVEVVIEDNGPGFPADVVAGLAHMTTTTRGFGLTIAKRSTELQGGLLWLEQRPAGGGVVHFTLPAPPAGDRPKSGSADPRRKDTS